MGDRIDSDGVFRALMAAAQTGDRSAYSDLLRQLAPLIRRVTRRRYPSLSMDDAEDLVQDVLLSLHSVRATYDDSRPFLPWLLAIVRNRAADALRRNARVAAREIAVEEYPETSGDAEPNMIGEGYGDPEALRLAMAALPEGQRRAIETLKLREMSLKEASAATGMSIAALKIATFRATRTLRLALKARDHGY